MLYPRQDVLFGYICSSSSRNRKTRRCLCGRLFERKRGGGGFRQISLCSGAQCTQIAGADWKVFTNQLGAVVSGGWSRGKWRGRGDCLSPIWGERAYFGGDVIKVVCRLYRERAFGVGGGGGLSAWPWRVFVRTYDENGNGDMFSSSSSSRLRNFFCGGLVWFGLFCCDSFFEPPRMCRAIDRSIDRFGHDTAVSIIFPVYLRLWVRSCWTWSVLSVFLVVFASRWVRKMCLLDDHDPRPLKFLICESVVLSFGLAWCGVVW